MEGNGNNNLVVGSDGAIYCMVKPPVYDVDNRTVEQGNFLAAAPIPGHQQMATARMRNLGLNMNVNMNSAMGAQSLLTSGLNAGNIRSCYPTMAVADGSVVQPTMQMQMQMPTVPVQPMGLMPDMALSSIGAYNSAAANNHLMLPNNPNPHGPGLNPSINPATFHANTAVMPAVMNQGDAAVAARRRPADELADSSAEGPSKRLKLMPLQGNQVPPRRNNIAGRWFPLYIDTDERNLSHYQCLARKQIEIFESTPDDANTNAQGRNRPIIPGQVGIRCRHCKKLPPKQRKTGSVYYPNRLDGVYQTAQKMTVGHLCKHCTEIPEEIRQKLLFLKDQKSSDGGGKRYWADGVRSLGVTETPKDGLAFRSTNGM